MSAFLSTIRNYDEFLTPPPLPIADVVFGRPLIGQELDSHQSLVKFEFDQTITNKHQI